MPTPGALLEAVVWYAAFLLSTTLHEAAHALVAKWGGDPTAYEGGQVSLDPRPHVRREPIGMVVLPLLSVLTMGWPFGFASAPYDPAWARAHPKRAGWMSLAGPAANLSLTVLAAIAIRLGVALGAFEAPDVVEGARVVQSTGGGVATGLAFVASVLFTLNLILALFNLLPFPPLDGSGALGVILPEALGLRLQVLLRGPIFGWIGIVLAWRLFDPLLGAVLPLVLNLLYPGSRYR